MILLLSDDLIFTSRVAGTGADLGIPVRVAKSPAALKGIASQSTPSCVILDLQAPGLMIADMAAYLKALVPPPTIVAYGSHVDVATLKAAREAGCEHVLPRSQFVQELPTNLRDWAGLSGV